MNDTDDSTPDQLSRRLPIRKEIGEHRAAVLALFPGHDSQPGEHHNLDHNAEHLADDGSQQGNDLRSERQGQREPEKPDGMVRKSVPALPRESEVFEGITARRKVSAG